MSGPVDEGPRLVEYLLGGLPEAEREVIAERLFNDDALSEDVQDIEDDLIQAYLGGVLSAEDRRRFESHFLVSPRRRRRLVFLKGLIAAIDRVAPSGRKTAAALNTRTWTAWAAAAVVVLAAAAVWLTRPAPPPDVVTGSPPPAPSIVPSAVATPAEVRLVKLPARGGADMPVPLSAAVAAVRLEVPVDPRQLSYDAVIATRDGTEVWRAEQQTPTPAGALVLTVPAGRLTADAYVLSVEPEQLRNQPSSTARTYTLRVVREK